MDTAYKQLIVFPVPTSDFSYTPKDTCTGPVTVKFTNLSQGAINYLWTFGNGNTSTNINPTNTYNGVGSYNIQLISNNEYNCFAASSYKYFVYQMPKALLDFNPDKGCPELEVNFENKSTNGTSYLWNFGDGETDTSFSPKHTYKINGKYKVKLFATNGGICTDTFTATKLVTVFAKPTPIFIDSLLIDIKPYRKVKFITNIDSVKTYEWYFKGKLIGKGPNPTFTFAEGDSGVFTMTLKITSIDGCDSSYSQTFELPGYWCGLYVPNAFTPSLGTGGANEFKPIGIEIKYYNIKIFNKWGELMWESSALTPNGEPMYGWDGNDINGIPCIQGSYIWVVNAVFTDGKKWKGMKLNDGELHDKGNVTLIR